MGIRAASQGRQQAVGRRVNGHGIPADHGVFQLDAEDLEKGIARRRRRDCGRGNGAFRIRLGGIRFRLEVGGPGVYLTTCRFRSLTISAGMAGSRSLRCFSLSMRLTNSSMIVL